MPNPDDSKLGECNNFSAGVSAVAIETPAFCSDKPEIWFAQLESQFALGNISVDSTKFHYVIAALNSDDLTCLISPELLKGLLIQRLPVQIQQLLSVSGDNLQALSKMADSSFEISKGDLVASVSANFQSSDVSADIPEHYNLLVNMKRKKLLDDTSAVSLEKPISANESMYVATAQGDSPYVKLLLKFSDITMPSPPKPLLHVKHNNEHCIETRGPPVFSKAR
ncbi:hypothetical protein AVEN_156771-1 [Araneus ventricosus]|uniref:DUF7041 domain-containing protein n=1 Tax=Araneus ventricosus TaxID=182803 RepID=A0A4Y2RSH8_ARAVE|nr:hypothetical protein AVEN_156771-1 [Araneus ventricosus]